MIIVILEKREERALQPAWSGLVYLIGASVELVNERSNERG